MTIRNGTTTARLRSCLETAALTLSGPSAGFVFHPSDPFWAHGSLSWLVLLPLLCGAQYGMAHGVASGTLLSVLALSQAAGSGHSTWVVLSNWSIGCLVVGAVAGQFRDVAERRRVALADNVSRMSEALQRAQRTTQVLQLSHARLEERLAATRWSLAGSLEGANRRMQELSSLRELGDVLLDVLSSQAMVQSASLFWGGAESLLQTPVASLGEKRRTSRSHPLVLRAGRTRRLAAVGDPATPRAGNDSDVLAAVPLLTSTGRMVGVVAIHQLPFMAFQTEHLRSLLVIAGQLADLMTDRLREVRLAASSKVATQRADAPAPASAPAPLPAPAPGGFAHHASVTLSRILSVAAPTRRVFDPPN